MPLYTTSVLPQQSICLRDRYTLSTFSSLLTGSKMPPYTPLVLPAVLWMLERPRHYSTVSGLWISSEMPPYTVPVLPHCSSCLRDRSSVPTYTITVLQQYSFYLRSYTLRNGKRLGRLRTHFMLPLNALSSFGEAPPPHEHMKQICSPRPHFTLTSLSSSSFKLRSNFRPPCQQQHQHGEICRLLGTRLYGARRPTW